MDFAHILLITSGIVLLVIVSLDMFTTIIHMGGGGFISRLVASIIWKCLFYLAGKNAKSRLLDFAGSTILIYLVFSWIIIVWVGFSLIFLAYDESVLVTGSNYATNAMEKIYFVGYSLTSLGNGDLKPGTDFWRMVSNAMSYYSLIFVSLAISYLLPVLQAVVFKNSLAVYIYNLGQTPQAILENAWNGNDFGPLYDRIINLESMILEHSERHFAYPVLHYFHSTRRKYSAPLNIAALDEAITIQEIYQLDKAENQYNWQVLRAALDNYLDKLGSLYIDPADQVPPFDHAKRMSILPHEGHATNVDDKIASFDERRKKLKGLVEKDGWSWEDLVQVFDEERKPKAFFQ